MREILFRGKRIDNGEWVEGYYAKAKYVISEKEMHIIFPLDLDLFPHSEFSSYEEVDPATVGRFTGLKDANGKSIFELDIFADADNECVGVVRWHNGSFKIFWYGLDGVMMPYGYDECAGKFGVLEVETFDDMYVNQMEVIGNIHDNPELFMEA